MIITLVSAGGAPGVTTAALGLALGWKRPVLLVENSISSPILAGFGRGRIAHEGGMLSLLAGVRDGDTSAAIERAALKLPGSPVRLIPGFTNSRQGTANAGDLWSEIRCPLGDLSASGCDVIVDAGRVGMSTFPWPLICASDRVILVARTSLVSIAGAACVVPDLAGELRTGDPKALQIVFVGADRPYSRRAACRILDIPDAGTIAWDPKSARVFSDGDRPTRRFEASEFQRSLSTVRAVLEMSATRSELQSV